MKSLTVKQAQKWFDKLKVNNPNSFKEILKHLKKFEKTNDQQECFIKINTVLLDHPELTRELNTFLQESNKFIVNRTEVQRINQLVKYVRKIKPQAFDEIVAMIKDLSAKKANSSVLEEEQNKVLKDFVLEKVRGNTDLQNYAEKALNYSAQEMIKKLDLSHLLRPTKGVSYLSKIQESVEMGHHQPSGMPSRPEQTLLDQPKPKLRVYPPFINTNEEKLFIKSLESYFSSSEYYQIIQIIQIYRLGIISKNQAVDFIKPHLAGQLQGMKDIIETRENDRRRNCPFKPLNDMDFTNSERATRSYVNMPSSYPHICSSSNELSEEVLNRKWVSVPQGSEDQFNLRVRNNFEQNLIRAEDQRHQMDLTLKKMEVSIKLVERVISILSQNPTADTTALIDKAIHFGIIQYVYRNATKEQKDEFEYHLKKNPYDTCCIFRDRIKTQLNDLREIRTIHGLKNWNEIATKNTLKSLDIKGHEFKRTQKIRMKPNIFLEELKVKVNYLQKRGACRSFDTPFQEKKQFFSVLNSFETSSRKQRCHNRKYTQPEKYKIENYQVPTLLPAMILAFEDQRAFNLAISYTYFYIENGISNQSEKARCTYILKLILLQFFGIARIQHRRINSDLFDEEVFLSRIKDNSPDQENYKKQVKDYNWVTIEEEAQDFQPELEQIINPKINFRSDRPSSYSYLPEKNSNNFVFFASENFYVLLRFIYAIYERIIRLFEVSEGDQNKSLLFELLYFNHIKTKENVRFEECLNYLFNENAFMFTTFYKLMQGLVKSASVVSNCLITNYSMKLFPTMTNQQMYLLLMNKYYLYNNVANPRILRFTYFKNSTKLLYINSLESFYKIDENNKDLIKRRTDITQKVQTYAYTIMRDYTDIYEYPHSCAINNKMQYHLEGNTIRLANLFKGQDLLVDKKYKQENKSSKMKRKRIEKEIQKLKIVHCNLG